jgi:sugar phosphate isomerase/epimerase
MVGEGKFSHNFYQGSSNGLDPYYGDDYSAVLGSEYRIPVSDISFPSDARSANQIKAVSDRFNTGAKAVEVSGVTTNVLESIPKQHFKEIERLKKLAGVDLTFHGPTNIDASGWDRSGWNEINRQGAERQIWSSVERAHDLDSKGNIIVTLHSSALGEPETRVMTKKGEKVKQVVLVDEQAMAEGRGGQDIIIPKKNELTGEVIDVEKEIMNKNSENWTQILTGISYYAQRGQNAVQEPLNEISKLSGERISSKDLIDLYKKSKEGEMPEFSPGTKEVAERAIEHITHGEISLRDAYSHLQNQFNKAWEVVEDEKDKKKLEKYRDEFREIVEKVDFKDPSNISEFGKEIQKGVTVLNSLSEAPKFLKPMKEFLIDKSSETFSNVALNAYKKFKSTSPIISIENPPAGGALSSGSDLRDLVQESREKFAQKAHEELGLSIGEAKKQAEKLIGVTWDVGHINMLRKYGYGEKELVKETEKVAPLVKHIHLSDNFGMDHTELPMGMGNVPTKKMFEALSKYNKQIGKMKKVVEAAAWYEPYKTAPFKESFRALGSPIYSMKMEPYWGGNTSTTYSVQGDVFPEHHFSLYGTRYTDLPPELGGQMSGRSRASGTPMN